jgi:hypothetical protein
MGVGLGHASWVTSVAGPALKLPPLPFTHMIWPLWLPAREDVELVGDHEDSILQGLQHCPASLLDPLHILSEELEEAGILRT